MQPKRVADILHEFGPTISVCRAMADFRECVLRPKSHLYGTPPEVHGASLHWTASMTDDPFELPYGDEFDPDSPGAAMARLRDRLRAIHPQAAAIITAHAALELEVDQWLRRFLARPEKLPRLSMEQQLGILRALLNDAWLDLVLDAIGAYGALRNAVAHHDSPNVITKAIERLGAKTYCIGMPIEPDTNLGFLAMNLAAALHVGAEGFLHTPS